LQIFIGIINLDKMLEMLHDSNRAILYGENGFQRVENFFSINKFYDNLRNLWIKYNVPT